jgi:hypothetical protein
VKPLPSCGPLSAVLSGSLIPLTLQWKGRFRGSRSSCIRHS